MHDLQRLEGANDLSCNLLSYEISCLSCSKLKCVKKLRENSDRINCIDWCFDNRKLVSANNGGAIIVWNVETSSKLVGIPLKSGWTQAVCFSPDGSKIACGGLDNLCSIFEVESIGGWHDKGGLADTTLQHHEGYISCIKYLDSDRILTSSGDGSIALWNISSHSVINTFNDHSHDVQSIATQFKPGKGGNVDKNVFISGACDAQAKLWDLRIGNGCVWTFEGHTSDINKIEWFPDNYGFLTASEDSMLKLFDIRCLKELNCYFSESYNNPCKDCDFSHSGRYIYASYDENPYCLIWDTISGKIIDELGPHASRLAIKMAPNGKYLATAAWDSIIRLWSI